jgi:hypothetical protein
MPSSNVSPPDSPIDTGMNKAVRDSINYWNCGSSDRTITTIHSPSRVSKSETESEQSSSSKITSKASNRKGEDCSTEAPQEKEERASSETPEEKKKRREERKAKKEQTEEKKGRKEGACVSETPEEKKKRRQERQEKKQKKIEKKETKEKELKTCDNSVPEVEVTEIRGSDSHEGRSCVSTASTNGSILRNGFGGVVGRRGHSCRRRPTVLSSQVSVSKCQEVYAASNSTTKDNSDCTDKSCFSSEEMKGKVLEEVNLLRHNVKTLKCQLKTANETIRQLDDRNARMSNLGVQLVKTEEELEYATEENKEYSSRVRALEQALILQESELDSALAVIRQNAKQSRDFLDTGNLSASEDVDEEFPIRKVLIASEKVNEQFSIRKELKGVRGELEQAQRDRDMAVDEATAASIQLTESRALIEQMRALMWQQDSPSSKAAIKRGFAWSKGDDKQFISFYDEDCTDATEDSTSVSSEDWNRCNEMDSHERRRQEEAYWNQPL